MPTLILLRHGQSQWNLEDRFTGWVDVDLTAQGVLTRAIRTSWLALHSAGQTFVPETKDWRLNERHYGGLTGLNKTETAAKHGDDQVKVWRRSYDIPPPDLAPGGEFDFSKDRRYAGLHLPSTESLKTTLVRVQPYWDAEIAPCLKKGETLLVAAHGNSLRAIVKVLFGVSDADIVGVEIPTSNPLVIELDANLKPTAARYLDETRATAIPPV